MSESTYFHVPEVVPLRSNRWGVICQACSAEASDYVPRCPKASPDEWPPTVLVAADAADPLLPKVRALYMLAGEGHSRAVPGCDYCDALAAFTPDDLARLGVKDGSE